MQSSKESFEAFVSRDAREQVPRMAQSWQASCQAAAVAVGGFFAVIIIGMVTHASRPWVMAAGLAIPVLLFGAVTAYEWRLGRRFGIELTRLHLIGIVAGLILWLIYQTSPGALPFDPIAAQLCAYVGHPQDHACLAKAHTALLHSDIAWWSTGALILLFGLFARRSRTAAWTAPAIAMAGSNLALYYLEVFVRAAARDGFIF